MVRETSYTPLPIIRNFVESYLQNQPVSTRMRQAVVDGLSGANVNIKLGGSDIVIPNVRKLSSYVAKVGDTVWVTQTGPDLLVVGKVAIDNVDHAVHDVGGGWISPTGSDMVLNNLEPGITYAKVIAHLARSSGTGFANLRMVLNSGSNAHRWQFRRRDGLGGTGDAVGSGESSAAIGQYTESEGGLVVIELARWDGETLWSYVSQIYAQFGISATSMRLSSGGGRVATVGALTEIRLIGVSSGSRARVLGSA